MTVKVTRCDFEELEVTLNEIGYENVVNIFPVKYTVYYISTAGHETLDRIGYTIIYKGGAE